VNEGLPGILLAAGFGRRWGAGEKLLHTLDGEPVVHRTARALLEGGLDSLLVVTREAQLAGLRRALADLRSVDWVMAEGVPPGLGTSLAAGVAALCRREPGPGFAVIPADLPWLRAESVARLRAVFLASPELPLRPFHRGHPGHPVFFPWSWGERLRALRGEEGAGPFLARAGCRRFEDAGSDVVRDLDQREAARAGSSGSGEDETASQSR
jgi:CTP:molybdopterin cytidylyltransferase MocA